MPGRPDKLASPSEDVVARSTTDGRVTLLAAPELAEALVARGLLRDVPLSAIDGAQPSRFAGRGRPVLLEVAGNRLVAKSMRRGGLFGRLLGDRFLGDGRARRLVGLQRELEAGGIATPRFAFARVRRGAGGLVRLDAGTYELAGALDGAAFLESRPPRSQRRAAVRAAARVVRALHDAGVEHADLNVKNLLVRAGPPLEAFVIDLEKSRRARPLARAAAVRNLARLLRSAEKLGLLGAALARTDLVRFVRAYGGGDWRSWFAAARRRHRALAPLHRIGWALRGRAAVTSS